MSKGNIQLKRFHANFCGVHQTEGSGKTPNSKPSTTYIFKGHYFNRKEWLGVNGESFVVHVLKAVIGKYRLAVLHQNWLEHYSYGEGSDFKIVDYEFNLLCEGEVKDWCMQDRPYGTQVAEEEILTRFTTQAPIKLLIITYLSLLTYKALELLKQHNITVIEVGGLMVGKAKTRLFKSLLKKLYPILKPLLDKAKPRRKFLHSNKQSKLTKHCYNTTTITPNKINNNVTNIQYKYDTTIRNNILNVYLPPNQQPHFTVKRCGSGNFG